jgi:FHA domain-containing protein/uncharacterized protein DUF1707
MRASDDSRERVVGLLRRRFTEGYLSTETFEARADVAYTASDDRELEALVGDLPPRRRWAAALRRLADAVPTRRGDGRPLVVAEPPHDAAHDGLVIGRNPDCDLVVADPTVSRRHAELRREDGRWILADLGSSNGTRVNGWRVRRATVGVGDELMLGDQRLVFARPRPPAPWWSAPERPVRG